MEVKKLNPWRAKTFALQADRLSHLGRANDAIRAAERSLELNPTLIPVREWLAVKVPRSRGIAEAT